MSDAPKQRILVVDDNDDNRYLLTRYFKKAGYDVWEGKTGADALTLAEQQPALITLDVQLPDLNGMEVCQRLKKNSSTANIPILQTSAAFTTSDDRIKGLEKGADGYLVMPVEPEELIATARALIRLREAELEAQKLANQWRATFDAINDGVCLLREDGCVERCNQSFAKIVGKEVSQILGQPVQKIFPPLFENLAVQQVTETRQRKVIELESGPHWYSLTLDPVENAQQEIIGLACIVSEITERKKTEEKLEQKVIERTASLLETTRQLEAFCYTISHDLRAPLRAQQGFAQAVLDDYTHCLDRTAQDYLQRIIKSAQRLDTLVVGLLAYSRLSRIELQFSSVDWHKAARELPAFFANEIREIKANVVIDELISPITGHELSVQTVLSNLFSNALKFVRPDVTPQIRVWTEQRAQNVRLWVEDNGIGIHPDHHNTIFGVFERLHTSEVYPGTGIGLAIVRKAVERMGGSCGVEARQEQGSRFWVELPKASG